MGHGGMMLSASQTIYQAIFGLPEPSEGLCYLCGGQCYRPLPLKDVIKITFTDFDIAKGDMSAGICCACAYLMNDKSEYITKLLNRDKPQRPRNYSHFVVNGKWQLYSKAQKHDMVDVLSITVPEVAIIAVSGQKHLVFKARLNPENQRSGWLLFEEQHIWFERDVFIEVFSHVNALYEAGYNKDAIQTGKYKFYPDSDLTTWREHEPALREWRGRLMLSLCTYLTTKEEVDDAE